MLNRNIIFLLVAGLIQSVSAQSQWCGTDEYNHQLLQNLPAEEAAHVQAQRNKIFQKSQNRNSKSGTVITIPIVIHVIHNNCEGNISKEQIEDGIAVMNEDFRRMNSDTNQTRSLFKPYAADTEIRFELANIDPNGNCTEGIVRVNSELANNGGNAVKALSYWSSSKYLNIWLVQSIGGSILGYAQFPGGSWSTFGLVVRSNIWGRIGTSNSDGRTASHEIGHCFGLYHTFQSGCGNDCASTGDRICDTPPVSAPSWGCSQSQNSCSNDTQGSNSPFTTNVVDMIENFMSYDNCQNMFTLGQAALMNTTLSSYSQLVNLVSSANLVATGTNPGYVKKVCAPIADFCVKRASICEGTSITYTDRSYNGLISGRNWSFPGGTPATSSDSVINVTYTIPGIHDVSLTVSNTSGSSAKTEKDIVYVDKTDADFSSFRYDEIFENQQKYDSLWMAFPQSNKDWKLTSDAAYSGVRSVRVFNFINITDKYSSELISPSYDLSEIILPKLFFKVAFARKSETSTDFLKIHYSVNCGESWNLMSIKPAILLESVSGYRTSNWAPKDISEWKEIEVNISSSIASKENLRFKFEFVGGGGNNIFLDDMNISSLTGVEDFKKQYNILIYPNPTTGILNINVVNTRSKLGEVSIENVSGQTVFRREYSVGLNNGSKETIDVSKLQTGIYFIQFVDLDGGKVVKKVIIE